MAKRRTRAQKAATAAKLRAAVARRPRDERGRLLSADAVLLRQREALERLRELSFMPARLRAKVKQQSLRAAEVKTLKVERRQRYENNPQRYKYKRNPNADTLKSLRSIEDGNLPPPTDSVQHGVYTEQVWTWQGSHALEAAQAFLLQAKTGLPPDAMGYLAVGNGHGKNSTWAGTKHGTPRDVWRHSQTFLQGKSGNTQALTEMMEGGEETEQKHLWAEVTMTTVEPVLMTPKEGSTNEHNRKTRNKSVGKLQRKKTRR